MDEWDANDSGYNWSGNYRTLGQWTIDVSYDGADWRTVDRFNCHDAGVTLPNIWMTDQFYMKRSVDFSSVGRAKTTRFDDGAVVRVVEGATLTIGNADETVGGLAGDGNVVLNDASLTLADGESTFSGALSSSANGTLVVDGGTFVLAKAGLKGLEKIVLKNGAVLSGRAYFNSDLVIEVGAGCENRLRQIGGMTLIVR